MLAAPGSPSVSEAVPPGPRDVTKPSDEEHTFFCSAAVKCRPYGLSVKPRAYSRDQAPRPSLRSSGSTGSLSRSRSTAARSASTASAGGGAAFSSRAQSVASANAPAPRSCPVPSTRRDVVGKVGPVCSWLTGGISHRCAPSITTIRGLTMAPHSPIRRGPPSDAPPGRLLVLDDCQQLAMAVVGLSRRRYSSRVCSKQGLSGDRRS